MARFPSRINNHQAARGHARRVALPTPAVLFLNTDYTAWRARLLQDMARAPWDAHLMTYTTLGVGGP